MGNPADPEAVAAVGRDRNIEQGIGESLGRAVSVRCVVANVELAAPDAAGDANLMAEARRIFADDLVDVGEIT